MEIRIDPAWIEALLGVYILLALCTVAVFVIWNVLKIVLKLVAWILFWKTGAKDLEELRTGFDRWVGASRERQIASGVPPTRRGAFKLLSWRIWKLAAHPIRYWRGEFLYPPKKDVPPTENV
jgi:hypothetical protein